MTAAVILHSQSPENQCPLLRQNSCIAQKHRSGAFFVNTKAQRHEETVNTIGRCAVRHNMPVEKYPAQFILPSRQGRNVLPATGSDFLFHTHIPSLTGRREMLQPVFSTNILCLRHKGGDIFLCYDKVLPCRNYPDRLNLSE
jgi:hypothetical protein